MFDAAGTERRNYKRCLIFRGTTTGSTQRLNSAASSGCYYGWRRSCSKRTISDVVFLHSRYRVRSLTHFFFETAGNCKDHDRDVDNKRVDRVFVRSLQGPLLTRQVLCGRNEHDDVM